MHAENSSFNFLCEYLSGLLLTYPNVVLHVMIIALHCTEKEEVLQRQ